MKPVIACLFSVASGLTLMACKPADAKMSDEDVCKSLVAPQIMPLAADLNRTSPTITSGKELAEKLDLEIRLYENSLHSVITQKIGIQIECNLNVSAELQITPGVTNMKNASVNDRIYFSITFSRTDTQSVVLRDDVYEQANAWIYGKIIGYVSDPRMHAIQ